ncbi:uncharacterized protein LOC127533242 [Acanthochromis polyacanthus]|uniref:uncharacterized protein LOC127533242 n=1 Tax=Acanthochromis polyacanthus TaxID=80966 RepID=UPI0022349150|nr:uncharacterized protein LOC127533242 [Acanthochromis polyacanthus]
MVQLQLSSLDQLVDSGFGRPFPRHGLQLLFWFANDCVTVESAGVMKLVSNCQPENSLFGFHVFRNVEELLPALKKRRNKKQVSYFEVGNLNTETYPASADLPAYVRENYGLDGNYGDDNSDRIIISYRARSRLVEAVYVTEHDDDAFGRFRADRTFQIHCDLIRVLQDQQLDMSSLLHQMGYYDDVQQQPSVQEVLDVMQTFSGGDFFSGFDWFMEPFNFNQRWTFDTMPSSRAVKPRRSRTKKKTRAVTRSYREPYQEPYQEPYGSYQEPYQEPYGSYQEPYRSYQEPYQEPYRIYQQPYQEPYRIYQQPYREPYRSYWEQIYPVFAGEPKKKDRGGGGGGGLGLMRILLGAGALYLAFRCFRWWMSSCWESDWREAVLRVNPWRVEGGRPPHVMLDYVF